MSEKVSVRAECRGCHGTGLYCGFAEPEGVAVVCLGCSGTGAETISYVPFTKRKRKRGVHSVRVSRGAFIATGVGPAGGEVSAAQFYRGQMPDRTD